MKSQSRTNGDFVFGRTCRPLLCCEGVAVTVCVAKITYRTIQNFLRRTRRTNAAFEPGLRKLLALLDKPFPGDT